MPDQPDDPRDYDMRIPPPADDKSQHKSEQPSSGEEAGKDDRAGQDELRPGTGRSPER